MGRGKTSAMINHINQSEDDVRYLFIVPLLTEVQRIKEACCGKEFVEPFADGGKLNNIKRLLAEGRNIVSTHALFGRFDDEAISLAKNMGYVLVMDEVTTVIRNIPITSYDCKWICENYVEETEDGKIIWLDDDYTGVLEPYKEQINGGNVYFCRTMDGRYEGMDLMYVMPREFFAGFRDMYLMTYMFKNQMIRCYFDMIGLPYQRLYVSGDSIENYQLSDQPQPRPDIDFSPLIHVLYNERLNAIGDPKTALSKNWYVKNAATPLLKKLQNNTYNFFNQYAKASSNECLWSTFCKDDIKGIDFPSIVGRKGFKKGFLACNSKGTNQFRTKTALAYLINVYPSTLQKIYLRERGVEIDDDKYALSEMLQWIWRSAIRDGKEIQLYLPSRRMRTLLSDWLTTKGREEVEW